MLDNFEQLLDAAMQLADLLRVAPLLKLLVTSRAPLHLAFEQQFAVPPLALTSALEAGAVEHVRQSAACALFIARAQGVKRDFVVTAANTAAIAAICTRLDGLPLAIELAAARSKALLPAELLQRLGQRLPLLTGGSRDLPARHQTIRATIDWSHTLLTAEEQTLFRRLGVFVGGYTMDAVEAVCPMSGAVQGDVLDVVMALVDQSLVQQTEGVAGEARFTMLETLREYALERLATAGELELLQRRHAAYYLVFAESAAAELHGPQQKRWLDRLAADHDNLRAALAWSLSDAPSVRPVVQALDAAGGAGSVPRAETGARIAGALWQFWLRRGYLSEGVTWLLRTLARVDSVPLDVRARGLVGAGILTRYTSNYAVAACYTTHRLVIL